MKIPNEAVTLLCAQRDNYHDRIVELYRQELSVAFKSMVPFLPPAVDRIGDIGAGLSGIDILLSNHYGHKPEIVLIDGEAIEMRARGAWDATAEQVGFRSTEAMARDILTMNGVPETNIKFADAAMVEILPKLDIIISLFSWGYNYPIKNYLAEVTAAAKPGAVLVVDIRKNTSGAAELNEAFGPGRSIYIGKSHQRFVFKRL